MHLIQGFRARGRARERNFGVGKSREERTIVVRLRRFEGRAFINNGVKHPYLLHICVTFWPKGGKTSYNVKSLDNTRYS